MPRPDDVPPTGSPTSTAGEMALRFTADDVEFGSIQTQWCHLAEPIFEAVESHGSVVNAVWIYHRDGEAFAFLDYYQAATDGG